MHQRKVADPESQRESTQEQPKRRVRRRRKPRKRSSSYLPFPKLALLAMILFSLLWIRLLWKIGTSNGDSDNNTSLFKLESEDAPTCQNLDSIDSIDTTLVTQLSDDRLWMMKHHCERYGPHPISIAVYTNSTRDEIQNQLMEMGCRIEGDTSLSAISLQTALVSLEVLDAQAHGSWNNYPVNQLRNLALKAVKTSHITYIDVDFWPSENLHDNLLAPPIKEALLEDPKLALVIPAFQLKRSSDCQDETLDCREEHVPKMPKTSRQLKRMIKNREAEIFDPTNVGGHGSTDYKHWLIHQQDPVFNVEDLLYQIPCLKSHRYEPFVTIRYCRELTPPFQQAFSGYGKNKMTWMMQVVASGFSFSQVGGAYLIHYPHAISHSRQDWNKAPKELITSNKKNYSVRRPKASDGNLGFEKYHRGKVDDLYIRFKEWLQEAIPPGEARIELCENAQDDDSKLWIDPERKNWKTHN